MSEFRLSRVHTDEPQRLPAIPDGSPAVGLLAGAFLLVALLLAPSPAAAGIIGHWSFDDPENIGFDASGTAAHAKIHGAAAAVGRERPGGGASGAVAFDGRGFLEVPRPPRIAGMDGFTVEAWVRSDGTAQASAQALLEVPGTLRLDANALRVLQRSAGLHAGAAISSPPPAGQWVHLVGVFDRGEVRLYRDGRLVGLELLSVEQLEGPSITAPWTFGRPPEEGGSNAVSPALVDEVTVYDEALSAGEILKLAANVAQRARIVPADRSGAAIQQALDQARNQGRGTGAEVFLPAGEYLLDRMLVVPGQVILRGEPGTVLKPAPKSQHRASPAILVNGAREVTLRDFEIDGQAGVLKQTAGHAGIFISGSSLVHVDGVTISNLGFRKGKPGGIHVQVEAREPGDGFTLRGVPLVTGVVSERNVVENCELLDPTPIASIGVRLMTSWQPRQTKDPFVAPVRYTVVRNNVLRGFGHNAMEIAGPATVYNVIRENLSTDALQTGIEADKGASYNLFVGNTIRGVWSNIPEIVAAMRDQGAYPDYWAEGNEFRNNVISGVTSQKWAAGIMLSQARGGLFVGNTIEDVSATDSRKGWAILLRGGEVQDYRYNPNTIDNRARQVKMLPARTAKKK